MLLQFALQYELKNGSISNSIAETSPPNEGTYTFRKVNCDDVFEDKSEAIVLDIGLFSNLPGPEYQRLSGGLSY